MKLRIIFIVSVLGMLIGLGLPARVSNAQTAKDIVGAWTLVSVEAGGADGSKSQPYGANPVGIIIFDASGHYSNLTSRVGLPKFASNNRTQGTPEENMAIVQGSIAHFGKYSVSEADKAIIFHIENSTYPNWNGAEQKRSFTVTGDELKYVVPTGSGGGAVTVVWKRAK